jgi:hypothetical protein
MTCIEAQWEHLTDELDAAWLAEIQRRAKDVDEGREDVGRR